MKGPQENVSVPYLEEEKAAGHNFYKVYRATKITLPTIYVWFWNEFGVMANENL